MTFPIWLSLISGLVTAMFSSAVRCGLEKGLQDGLTRFIYIKFPAVPGIAEGQPCRPQA